MRLDRFACNLCLKEFPKISPWELTDDILGIEWNYDNDVGDAPQFVRSKMIRVDPATNANIHICGDCVDGLTGILSHKIAVEKSDG